MRSVAGNASEYLGVNVVPGASPHLAVCLGAKGFEGFLVGIHQCCDNGGVVGRFAGPVVCRTAGLGARAAVDERAGRDAGGRSGLLGGLRVHEATSESPGLVLCSSVGLLEGGVSRMSGSERGSGCSCLETCGTARSCGGFLAGGLSGRGGGRPGCRREDPRACQAVGTGAGMPRRGGGGEHVGRWPGRRAGLPVYGCGGRWGDWPLGRSMSGTAGGTAGRSVGLPDHARGGRRADRVASGAARAMPGVGAGEAAGRATSQLVHGGVGSRADVMSGASAGLPTGWMIKV